MRTGTASAPPRGVPGRGLRVALAPNPATAAVTISFDTIAGRAWRLEVLDLLGRHVRDIGSGSGSGLLETRTWSGHDGQGAHVPAGLYWVRLMTDGRQFARRLAMLQAY